MLEKEVYQCLAAAGVPTPEYSCFPLEGALTATSWPVALKIMSPRIVHKSDLGGVALHLNNQEELEEARKNILHRLCLKGFTPDSKDEWIVTRQYTGIELFFGVVQDPVFGKVILFGAGGTTVELFRDICYIDSEAGEQEIRNGILQTRVGQYFARGFRGIKYDPGPIVALVQKLQRIEVRELDCNPVILTEEGPVVVDARMVTGTCITQSKPLKFIPEIFRPQRTAIIGVSSHPEKVGYALAKNNSGDPDCYYVNPHLDKLFDKQVFPRVEDLPQIDTAVLCIPPAALKDSIVRLAVKNVKNVVIITAGFREAGRDEHFLEELAAKYGIHIIGPNCLGIYANGKNLTFGPGTPKAGDVNFFSQSGAIVAELMDKAVYKNIGFANIISAGNMADVDFADLIHSYEGAHPVNLYIEGVSNGKNLLRAIRGSKVPVRIFKAGRTEAARKAAFSHTGNLAGNYEMFTGLLKSVGATMMRDINGLLYPYHFEKVLVITNAGGAGTVISDMISDKLYPLSQAQIDSLSKVLPKHWSKNNPIDIIGDATYERYLKALTIADSFGADAILVVVTPQFMTDTNKIGEIFYTHPFRTKVFPVLLGGEKMETACRRLRSEGVTYFEELSEAVSYL
ncbi:acetate--CoA ligase family protein [Flavitalea sp. BT771]|uniref:acetate--CoA ligase family protein n=1 Tax=Flavitalea sp. BT771 TaxID=3063329 RepID=UPI0026E2CDDD|nr:acetate--CoA ligase family protein [Flavitalea sp. BT771]MDO6428987.1 acetate--CoA ligase family protein [Flavitalea sp. BT771]MDV6218885.1 acetate--CoA ligase family protein [Flavitalea sp. BT771]